MRARPISITIVGWLFVAVGAVGLFAQTRKLLDSAAFDDDMAYATASELASLLGGAFLLDARNWARWLLVAWMAFHLVLSAVHDLPKLLVHVAIFAPILYVLFRAPGAAFFTRRRAAGTPG